MPRDDPELIRLQRLALTAHRRFNLIRNNFDDPEVLRHAKKCVWRPERQLTSTKLGMPQAPPSAEISRMVSRAERELEDAGLERIQIRYLAATVICLLLLGGAAFWVITLVDTRL